MEACEDEAEKGAGEDEEEDEVVAFLEADGVVDLSHEADEGVRVWVVDVESHVVVCGEGERKRGR